MELALHTLTCFKHIETIEPITAGLSSHCYKINADKKYYFVKQLTTKNEAIVGLSAASNSIGPAVVYHDQHWLVTEYIDGINLTLSSHSLDQKIKIACQLMAKCHQLTAKPLELSPKKISHDLIRNSHFSSQQQITLLHLANQLIPRLKSTNKMVCCHGDLNFSNLLIDKTENAYLVDFECACIASAEYDLAMFIAVNVLTKKQASMIIDQYQYYSSIKIDLSLVDAFLSFCYILNGLWYAQAYNNTKDSKFSYLAKQQWQHVPALVSMAL